LTTVDVNGKPETRVVLGFAPRIAPGTAAVLPLLCKPKVSEPARRRFEAIARERNVVVVDDETDNIGKRDRRQDEIGPPFGVTIDNDPLDDQMVPVRMRDDLRQERRPIADVPNGLAVRIV
jgi:glycyl-tRNA synthetase